jgi:hypothetical protein
VGREHVFDAPLCLQVAVEQAAAIAGELFRILIFVFSHDSTPPKQLDGRPIMAAKRAFRDELREARSAVWSFHISDERQSRSPGKPLPMDE